MRSQTGRADLNTSRAGSATPPAARYTATEAEARETGTRERERLRIRSQTIKPPATRATIPSVAIGATVGPVRRRGAPTTTTAPQVKNTAPRTAEMPRNQPRRFVDKVEAMKASTTSPARTATAGAMGKMYGLRLDLEHEKNATIVKIQSHDKSANWRSPSFARGSRHASGRKNAHGAMSIQTYLR